jgi:hypothetical protein
MLKFLLLFFLIPFYSYSGCEDGDCNNGYGTYIWFNGDADTRGWVEGDKYVGMFLNGKMHGQGILYFKNGNIYNGSFHNGSKSGYGSLIYKNGEKYLGNFLNDKKHGTGILITNNGEENNVRYKFGVKLKDNELF